MRSRRADFEVRCPRCDVSFPVETRTCIHCGGKTATSTATTSAEPIFALDSGFEAASTQASGMAPAAAFDAPGQSFEPSSQRAGPEPFGDDGSETPNVGRSILGSMGSLIWIALLIAFSLAGRVCGE